MNCHAFVRERAYSKPGPCLRRQDVRLARWSVNGLNTRTALLCPAHREVVNRKGDVELTRDMLATAMEE